MKRVSVRCNLLNCCIGIRSRFFGNPIPFNIATVGMEVEIAFLPTCLYFERDNFCFTSERRHAKCGPNVKSPEGMYINENSVLRCHSCATDFAEIWRVVARQLMNWSSERFHSHLLLCSADSSCVQKCEESRIQPEAQ